MTFRIAERMSRLGTESAFEVLAHARQLEAEGRSIIHLEIGEPDFATPQNIIDAAVRALNDGATHYTPASGIPQVREATARYITKHTGVPTKAENIVLTPGSKNILLFALLILVEEGDEVIIPDPGYPIYRSLVEFIGGKAVSLPVRQENSFRIDPAELRSLVTDRTRVLIVNSPANPTGGVLTRDDCEQVAKVAMEHDLVVISDEIYNRLVYDGSHLSLYTIDGMPERTILLDGLSKAWAMCGWRLGFGAMPVEIARRMDTLMINSSSCAAAFTQWAAVEAFESTRVRRRRDDDGRGVPQAARHPGRGAQQHARRALPPSGRRLLCFSGHHRNRLGRPRAGQCAAGRGRRRRAARLVLRASRRGPHPAQLRQLSREPQSGRGSHRDLPRRGGAHLMEPAWPPSHAQLSTR